MTQFFARRQAHALASKRHLTVHPRDGGETRSAGGGIWMADPAGAGGVAIMRALFITLEGGEGAGKSTQARRLAATLATGGTQPVLTREPGGAPGAEALRQLLLSDQQDFAPLAELMLHFAARAEHMARTIKPALAAGRHVLCDRFFDSTEAYQVAGQGADRTAFEALKALITPHPDLTLVLDVSAATATAREAARGRAADRYDTLGPVFQARVREAFRVIAARELARCVLIDADQDEDAVAAAIWQAVEARL